MPILRLAPQCQYDHLEREPWTVPELLPFPEAGLVPLGAEYLELAHGRLSATVGGPRQFCGLIRRCSTPIRTPLSRLIPFIAWPGIAGIICCRVCNAREVRARFIHAHPAATAIEYESRIAETGEIATRENNWHDLFNALVWLSFPAPRARSRNACSASCRTWRSGKPNRDPLGATYSRFSTKVASSLPRRANAGRAYPWIPDGANFFWERRAE